VNLRGATVLLTGATGGLGQAFARAFAARGASLLLTGRRAEVLEPLALELGARALACDLAERRALDALIAGAGEVDVLVANAALPASGALSELTAEQIDVMLDVNLRAPIVLARALSPGMAARGHGHLAFVSSLAGKAASPMSSIYSATKFGLRGFALGLRQDLRDAGVGVSVVLPGFVSGAGLFADAGVELPFGVGTRTPEQVAEALIEGVEHNRAEVTVAPPLMRIGTAVAAIAPNASANLQRVLGAEKVASEMVAAQLRKRPPPGGG
jgi:short-subunit dehydrogenase